MTLTPRSETTDILTVVLPRRQSDEDVKMLQVVVVVLIKSRRYLWLVVVMYQVMIHKYEKKVSLGKGEKKKKGRCFATRPTGCWLVLRYVVFVLVEEIGEESGAWSNKVQLMQGGDRTRRDCNADCEGRGGETASRSGTRRAMRTRYHIAHAAELLLHLIRILLVMFANRNCNSEMVHLGDRKIRSWCFTVCIFPSSASSGA